MGVEREKASSSFRRLLPSFPHPSLPSHSPRTHVQTTSRFSLSTTSSHPCSLKPIHLFSPPSLLARTIETPPRRLQVQPLRLRFCPPGPQGPGNRSRKGDHRLLQALFERLEAFEQRGRGRRVVERRREEEEEGDLELNKRRRPHQLCSYGSRLYYRNLPSIFLPRHHLQDHQVHQL